MNVQTPIRHGVRTDWTRDEVAEIYQRPLLDLLLDAQIVHRRFFRANGVQACQLLSIKTGGCPEDCGYCSQSAFAKSGVKAEKLMQADAVIAAARRAKESGASRFCMGAAWRDVKDRDMDAVCEMVAGVKALGLETCMTLGMLSQDQAEKLSAAGLDYYNHNLDTSPEHYGEIISTRTYAERLQTLEQVRSAGMNVCCGGIVGMGEARRDRVGLIHALATLPQHPKSVPVNALVPVKGTKRGDALLAGEHEAVGGIEFVRAVATCRLTMPASVVRLSAGRESMSPELQALCFMAGANSIFTGDTLLTAPNAGEDSDASLLRSLGLTAMEPDEMERV
ncbi:biotin synthase BioB [Pacificimonas flava]|uniref:Biotin synthase n=1 Tax=Pacificimonas flava TaxID=1234595 RepID=M2T914_9SPHN|nr:biotin synthase BioB [Pacificimonas flava]EMD83009.1 Biotin synthase [Pacificimonas flava]MBB5280168.1 biotin synthase [Pacificimonas flava]